MLAVYSYHKKNPEKMITSKTNPKIKNVIKLEKASERREQNRIIIEGRREIERAVACGFEIDTLFIRPEIAESGIDIQAHTTEEVTLEVFEKIAYREGSDGMLAIAIPRYSDLRSFKPKRSNPLIIVLENVEKPGNLGAVMRTADAAGVDAVIIADKRTDLYNPNAIRASVGCIFSVPLFSCSSQECIKWLCMLHLRLRCRCLPTVLRNTSANRNVPTSSHAFRLYMTRQWCSTDVWVNTLCWQEERATHGMWRQ